MNPKAYNFILILKCHILRYMSYWQENNLIKLIRGSNSYNWVVDWIFKLCVVLLKKLLKYKMKIKQNTMFQKLPTNNAVFANTEIHSKRKKRSFLNLFFLFPAQRQLFINIYKHVQFYLTFFLYIYKYQFVFGNCTYIYTVY